MDENISALQLNPPESVQIGAVTPTSVELSWTAVDTAENYRILRSETENGTYAQIGTTAATNYTDTGLAPETTYYYKIRAYSAAEGEGTETEATPATTASIAAQPQAPGIPVNVTATANGCNAIRISWQAVPEATGYRVYRSNTAAGTYTLVGTVETSPFNDRNLQPDTTYYYQVAAYIATREGARGGPVSATTRACVNACCGDDICTIRACNGRIYLCCERRIARCGCRCNG